LAALLHNRALRSKITRYVFPVNTERDG